MLHIHEEVSAAQHAEAMNHGGMVTGGRCAASVRPRQQTRKRRRRRRRPRRRRPRTRRGRGQARRRWPRSGPRRGQGSRWDAATDGGHRKQPADGALTELGNLSLWLQLPRVLCMLCDARESAVDIRLLPKFAGFSTPPSYQIHTTSLVLLLSTTPPAVTLSLFAS